MPGRSLLRLIGEAFSRLRSETQGTILVMSAFVFPVVIAAFGLGAETGYWYMTERKLQHAADLSAHAAGARNRAGDSLSEITAAATYIAEQSGFDASTGTVTVNLPPASGAFVGDTDSVEVILEENRSRWFSAVFEDGPVAINARAVSRITGGTTACILALSPTAPGALTISGSTSVALNDCGVASNSSASDAFLMDGTSATLSAGCVSAVGEAVVTTGLTLTSCTEVKSNAPTARDPYEDVAEPEVIGDCQNSKVGRANEATIITPTDVHPSGMNSMRFCAGLDIKGIVTFMPGLYIIEGGSFDFNGGNHSGDSLSTIIGTGVTFYLTDTADIQLNGNVQLNLSAPTSGTYSGILFYGARDATAVTNKLSGTSDTTLQGAIYAPASLVEFAGSSTVANGCTQVVASQITLTGSSTVSSDCDLAGTETILANQSVSIAE